ncbi:exopolysaccharide biosynthesis protein [[Clostridium] hylemonae]|nr:glycosyltransferase [[Clostridium] hylemonae]MCB7520190.1 exopolysaccharide biosynthesis protein [[Clostridium] hylemonae]
MIPKVIHYCWFGKKPLPGEVKKCIKSWEKYCPGYEIKEWNESNFDIDSHLFTASAYREKAWAFVSDYARLKIIYDNGGVYFDTDVELLKNIDFLLENSCYIGVQQCECLCTTGLGFGAARFNPAVLCMLREYDGLEFTLQHQKEMACPYLNSKAIEKLGYRYSEKVWEGKDITVYPFRYFDPIAPGNSENLLCGDTVSIHQYSASWTSGKNRFKRKIFRMIGAENVYKLKKLLKCR